jgi:hypothetical protein
MREFVVGIVFVLLLSSAALAIKTGYTAETRYATEQTTIVPRDIVFSSNRYWQTYVKPYGGFGEKGASRGSFGAKGEEEGASNLATNDFISRGRDPSKISNSYSSARGYHIVNKYVELDPVELAYASRPQINVTPKGYSRIISMNPYGTGLTEGTVYLRTKDLPPLAPLYLYEAWLADEDTGFAMSIGMFQPASIGRITSIDYLSVTPLDAFDCIMVTVEPFPDDNPLPGQIILEGSLKGNIVRSP